MLKVLNIDNPSLILPNLSLHDVKSSRIRSLFNEDICVRAIHLNSLFKGLESEKISQIFDHCNNSEIIHCIAGLFDVCLSDMDLDTIYSTIVDEEAYTVVFYRTKKCVQNAMVKEGLKEIKEDKINELSDKISELNKNFSEENDFYDCSDDTDELTIFDDNLINQEDHEGSGDEEESEDEEEYCYTNGYNSYRMVLLERKLLNYKIKDMDEFEVGLEHRLIGAVSFKLRKVDLNKITHITMIGVMPRYRSGGLGNLLLQYCLDPTIVGHSNACVVHADYSAVEFFRRTSGFSDDPILNLQWHSLEPEYTNCSLMTWLPPYSSEEAAASKNQFSTAEMEVEMKLYQQKAVLAHCQQANLFRRMQAEIELLNKTIKNQDDRMKEIMKELRDTTKEKDRLEKFINNQSTLKAKFEREILKQLSSEIDENEGMEKHIKSLFNSINSDPNANFQFKVLNITLSNLPNLLISEYKASRKSLSFGKSANENDSEKIMFFCQNFHASYEDQLRILSQGFSSADRKIGIFGNAWHFSTNPIEAAIFIGNKSENKKIKHKNSFSSILIAKVCPGKVWNPTNEDLQNIAKQPDGFDSVVSNTSMTHQDNNDISQSDGLLLYSSRQILPVALVKLEITEKLQIQEK